jgi:hypothetical protein
VVTKESVQRGAKCATKRQCHDNQAATHQGEVLAGLACGLLWIKSMKFTEHSQSRMKKQKQKQNKKYYKITQISTPPR